MLLTHANIVAAVAGVQESIAQSRLNVGSEDSFLSYLPMAHILDRVIEEYLLSAGSSVGYWQVKPCSFWAWNKGWFVGSSGTYQIEVFEDCLLLLGFRSVDVVVRCVLFVRMNEVWFVGAG